MQKNLLLSTGPGKESFPGSILSIWPRILGQMSRGLRGDSQEPAASGFNLSICYHRTLGRILSRVRSFFSHKAKNLHPFGKQVFCIRKKERRDRDSNPGYPYGYNGFRDRPFQPLRHLSKIYLFTYQIFTISSLCSLWFCVMSESRPEGRTANPPESDFLIGTRNNI